MANSINVLVDVNDVNEAPRFDETFGFSVMENAVANSFIGVISAKDEDRIELHAFNIEMINDNMNSSEWVLNLNNINSTTSNAGSAELYVTEFGESNLDYEASINFFNVSILVIDKGGLSDSCVVRVTVDDINEPPAPNKTHAFWTRENVAKGAYVGYPVLSGDPDYSDAHDYVLQNGLQTKNRIQTQIFHGHRHL